MSDDKDDVGADMKLSLKKDPYTVLTFIYLVFFSIALTVIFAAVLFGGAGCASVPDTVLDDDGPVIVNERIGASPYHRVMEVYNGRSYPIDLTIRCSYNYEPYQTFFIKQNYRVNITFYLPKLPRHLKNSKHMCELMSWNTHRSGTPYID